MKTAHGTHSTCAIDDPETAPQDLHHGDLRKGAYLRRRAAYQMQAGNSSSGLAPATKRHHQPE